MPTAPDRHYNDVDHYGTEQFIGPIVLPNGYVTNAAVASAAGIDASKLDHRIDLPWSMPGSVADENTVMYSAKSAGTIDSFVAGSEVKAVGDAVCTFDVKKNGTTILTGVITIDNGNTNYVAESGSLAVTTYVAGDCFEIVVDATIGTGTLPVRAFARLTLLEAA